MKIVLSESTQQAIETVATLVTDQISVNPASVIGLATGRTMEPVYEAWVKLFREKHINHSKSFFFHLDEYLNLPEDHPSSFRTYLQQRLQIPLGLKTSQFAYHAVHTRPIEQAALHYEQSIKESGGIDIQLLGIGRNGHIGFNEPGSNKESRTRVVNLTLETRHANQADFADGNVPATAISMGIGTILEAKSLLLLATGKSKADAIKYLLNHHDETSCPATFLKSHPHFTLVLDPDAASKINLKI